MTHRPARRIAAGLAGALLISGCGIVGGDDSSDPAREIAVAFLADWAGGKVAGAAARTTDPATATDTMTEMQETLRLSNRVLTPGQLTGCDGGEQCRLEFDAELELEALGTWTYTSELSLVEAPEDSAVEYQVRWEPAILHPRLTDTTAFSRVRELPPRAAILDRDGQALVSQQAVVRVGIEAGRVPDGAIEQVAELTDVNVDGLLIRTNRAEEGQFVEAVVLRQADYDAIAGQLAAIDGVIAREDTLTLAPTRQFARGVLGAVGNATAESLRNAGPTASSVDSVGLFGMQSLYQKQLAGRPGGRVELVNSSTTSPIETLVEFTAVPGTALRTALDLEVQTAAEQALTLTGESSSLVAIDTTTGDVLAVANGPVNKAGEDRALAGQYAPGSTFKIVSMLALLRSGLSVDDAILCSDTVNVEGRQFENYDGLGALGRVSLRTNFTQSCNTAFVRTVSDLEADALTEASEAFGIGADWDLVLDSFSGDVPPSRNRIGLAADGLGQGRVLMSPLSMASVAATVATGTPRHPRLVLDGPPADEAPTAGPATVPTPGATAEPSSTPSATLSVTPSTDPATAPPVPDDRPVLDPVPEAATLRELMLATVRSGTAQILNLPGVSVGAKTGTAEYGSETEPGKHAWMVGFAGTIAFAVIVERGDTGARTAGPIARAFLQSVT